MHFNTLEAKREAGDEKERCVKLGYGAGKKVDFG